MWLDLNVAEIFRNLSDCFEVAELSHGYHGHAYLNTSKATHREAATPEARADKRRVLESNRRDYKAEKQKQTYTPMGVRRGPKLKNRKPKCHPERPHEGRDLCKYCFNLMAKSIDSWKSTAQCVCVGRDLKPSEWKEILTNPSTREELEAFTDFVHFLVKCRDVEIPVVAIMLQTNESEVRSALASRGCTS
jgi:hypothetical protein